MIRRYHIRYWIHQNPEVELLDNSQFQITDVRKYKNEFLYTIVSKLNRNDLRLQLKLRGLQTYYCYQLIPL